MINTIRSFIHQYSCSLNLGRNIFKLFKINLRSCSHAPGLVLSSHSIHPPIIPPNPDSISNSSRKELNAHFMLTTTNDDNVSKIDLEEVKSTIEGPMNTSCNHNIRNDVDCREVRWMENNSEVKKDQISPIPELRLLLVKC